MPTHLRGTVANFSTASEDVNLAAAWRRAYFCKVGDVVNCFQGNPGVCAGDGCCMAQSGQTWTCPSASVKHISGCDLGKAYDCTPVCDLSRCDGCSGTVCETCRQDEEVKCCLDQKCNHCSGEQCELCRKEHLGKCCQGKSPAVAKCRHHVQPPVPRPTCQIGDYVHCFQGNPGMCAGDQCCTARSGQTWTCPSASVQHISACDLGKAYQC